MTDPDAPDNLDVVDDRFTDPRLTTARLVELLRDDQRRRWQAGRPMPAARYLDRFPQVRADSTLALDLIWSEYLIREDLGDKPTLEEYAREFPQYASLLARQHKVHMWVDQAGTTTTFSDTLFDPPSADGSARTGRGERTPWLGPARSHGYEILGEEGRGGMGVVYRALDRRRGKVVALKMMRDPDPSALYRFKQEFHSLADVSHKNLVTLHELISDGRDWFFTMDLVDGVDFLTFVRPPACAREADAPTALEIGESLHSVEITLPTVDGDNAQSRARFSRLRACLVQLAEGVAALHEAGWLHRDLKPSNVLVTGEGRVVILDFGLGADLGPAGLHQSSVDHLLGTVAYMSPEQAVGGPVTAASDWYSVGVMLYEALTGRLPLAGGRLAVLLDKQRVDLAPPGRMMADLPADLDELCSALLARDPEARPDAAEVFRRLRGGPSGRPVPAAAHQAARTSKSLVGRKHHRSVLSAAYSAMRRGGTVLVLVHGPSGIGKTALIEGFLEGLPADDRAVILRGRCYAQESVPYKALDGIIDNLGRALRRFPKAEIAAVLPREFPYLRQAFPTLRMVKAAEKPSRRLQKIADPRELRKRCGLALRDLLGRLGDRCPLVLVIDDLQWGDQDSAALLVELLEPPDPPALLLVGCYRREDSATSPFLTSLLGAFESRVVLDDHRDLAVDELTGEDALNLARILYEPDLDDPSREAVALSVARESGGNPFFIEELVRHTRARRDRFDPSPVGGKIRLDEMLRERLHELSTVARRVLEVIVVFGRPIGEKEACRAAGVWENEEAVLGQLRAARLIRNANIAGSRHGFEVYHDRIRESLLALLPAHEVESHHLRLATTLRAMHYPDPEVLAIHFREAGCHSEASLYFAEAGDQAVGVLAFDRASALYRSALRLDPAGVAESRSLHIKLGHALANAGRGGEAAGEYLAAAVDNSDESLDLRCRAALQYLISGHVDEGLATLKSLLGVVGMSIPRSSWNSLVSLLLCRTRLSVRGTGYTPREPSEVSGIDQITSDICWSASIGLSIVDPVRGADFQSRGLLHSLRHGDPGRVVRALAMEAAHVACAGLKSRHRTAHLLDRAESLAQGVTAPYTSGIILLTKGMIATLESRWQETRAFADPAEAIFRDRCTGVAWEIDTARIFSLWSLMYLGEIAELQRLWPGLMRDAIERNDLYAIGTIGTLLMAVVRLANDAPDQAENELSQTSKRWSRQGFHIQHHNQVLAECYISLYRADGRRTWERLSKLWPVYTRSLLLRIQVIRIELRRLRALGALTAAKDSDNPGPFLRSATREARRLDAECIPGSSTHARLIRGQALAATGDFQGARPLLESAIREYTSLGMAIFAAATRRRLGELLGGDDGRELVNGADGWMTSQGIRKPSLMAALYAAPVPRANTGHY